MKTVNSILLIDDDAATNFYHKIIVKRLNCCNRLDVFDDATEALQYLEDKQELPDIIFLDINMPKMDGWQFVEALTQSELKQVLGTCKIIMLTTSLNPNDKQKALSYEIISDFRLKPLTKDILEDVLNGF